MPKDTLTISFSDVFPFLDQFIKPVDETLRLPITDALGYVIAENIYSPLDVPQFDNSAMDGWALKFADLPNTGAVILKEVGQSFAGHPYEKEVLTGQCIRIMTGGKIPAGVDTVIKQELTSANGTNITIPSGAKIGDNVRKQGEEISKGSLCLAIGTQLHAPEISFLASLGIAEITVYRKIRVAFFSTGDELQSLGTPLKNGCIYDSNRYAIAAMLKEAGFETLDLGIVPDQPEFLEKTLLQAANSADAIITSGGVSVGEADYTRSVLTKIGSLVDWHCSIRPGRPLSLGKIGKVYFFGLPGNPIAAQVTFYEIVKIALNKLSGSTGTTGQLITAVATTPLSKKIGHTEFQRGILSFANGKTLVASSGSQKTGIISSMTRANCFIVLDEKQGPVDVGETVNVQVFSGICY